ncbi:universal stress protein [Streptomyces sp. NPDC059071]
MGKSLVVRADGSAPSLTAPDWAVDEAVRHGFPLRIVHASLWERYEGVVPASATDRPSDQILAENIVGIAAERARRGAPDLPVTTPRVPSPSYPRRRLESTEGEP